MSNIPNFVVRMPASNYGQTSPAWNAGSIINVNVDNDPVQDGDQLYYDQNKNLWVTEKRTHEIYLALNPGSALTSVRYDPIEQKLYYKPIHYGQLFSTIQQNIAQNDITRLTYNNLADCVGIGYNAATPWHITFSQIGVYKIGASILFRQNNGSGDHVFFAFHKNDNLIPNSSSDIFTHGNNASALAFVEIIVNITSPTDLVEIVCFSDSSRIYCPAVASPHPSIGLSPSIITTVIQIA